MLSFDFFLYRYALSLPLKFIILISELYSTYSWWWLAAVMAAGLVYAFLLYFKNPVSRLSFRVSAFLFVVRFVSTSLLLFLLLSPFIKTRLKTKEKPIVIVGVDNSQSIILSPDSSFYKNQFKQDVTTIVDALKKDYQTDFYLFGDKTRQDNGLNFSDSKSDYTSFFKTIKENYRGLNVGAIVLAGDGLYNRGSDPAYSAANINWPVYTIALGDTNTYSDLKINDVRFNKMVYLNDRFPVEININAEKLSGKKATLKVSAFGKVLEQQSFLIQGNSFSKTFRVLIPATEKGKHRVTISLSVFNNELNRQNNRKSIFVNVLDSRQKILIVAAAPHPDVSAIKQSLTGFRDYRVEVQYVKKLTTKPGDYDLVILYQVPCLKHNPTAWLKTLQNKKIPILYILGKLSNLTEFNNIGSGLQVIGAHNTELSQPIVNRLFNLFTFGKEQVTTLESLPPLTTPFGNYKPSERANIFAYQKINNLDTDIPLILFYEKERIKNAVITGEGIWLWRMHDYLLNSNFYAVESLLGKTVQYLTAREDKRHLKIISKEEYLPGDKVKIKAELYNDSWELINNNDASLTLTNEQGKQFKYSFSPFEEYYNLTLENLEPGVYRYTAKARIGDKKYSDKGEFVVNTTSEESRKLQADYSLMYRLASENRGIMIYPNQMNSLPAMIKKNQNVKTRIVYSYRTRGVNDIWYILALVLFLLSLEWFLRKYFGSY